MADVAALGAARYISLVTYKKDGTPVPTPLWVVPDGPALVLWTVADSWKVKRIRRNPRVTVTPCSMRGKPLGEPVEGLGEIMPLTEGDRVRSMIKRKYGLQGWLTVTVSVLRRGRDATLGLRVTV